jgi:diguanylate cyclase (GGDEF)-like protein/PAS domain S-box-containing protein
MHQQSLHEVDAIFCHADIGIAHTFNKVFKRCNAVMEKLLGFSPGELHGASTEVLFHTRDEYVLFANAVGQTLADGRLLNLVWDFKDKAGRTVTLKISATPVNTAPLNEETVWLFDDITDEVRKAGELTQTTAELAAVMDNAPVSIIFTKNREITRCNQKFNEMFAFGETSAVGCPGRALYCSDDDYAEIARLAAPLLSCGKPFIGETRMARQDGSHFWAQIVAYVLNPVKASEGTVWIISDRSKERQQEEAIHTALFENKVILDNVVIGIVFLKNRMVQRCNRQAEKIFGYKAGCMLGETTRSWYASDSEFQDIGDNVCAKLASGHSQSFERMLSRRNGETFWARLTGRLCDDKDPMAGGSIWVIEDTSAQHHAEAALRSATNLMGAVFNSANVSIISTDTQGIISLINETAQRWLGYTAEEVVGKTTPAIIHDQDEVIARATVLSKELGSPVTPGFDVFVAKARLQGTDEHEWTFVRKSGARFPVHLTISALRDQFDEITGYIGIGIDITDRQRADRAIQHNREELERRVTERTAAWEVSNKQLKEEVIFHGHTEALLRNSEAILSATINTALDGMVQIDAAGIITRWNNQAEKMFGWLRVEVIGLELHETIIPPQYREAHIRGMQHFLSTGEGPVLNKRIEISALHRDGHTFPIELSITPLKIADKYEFNAFLRDITERKQNEKKLELAASVFTHAREGILITDATGTIVDVNDTFTRITGYLREEALGQNPRILSSGRQPPEFYAAMWSSLAENGHWSGEIWNRRKNGEVYAEMQTVSAVRDASGAAQHYVSLFSDITAQKEQQQQLEHIAHFDALTNLPNRVLLDDRLHQAMLQSRRRGKSLAVAYLDLDGFKQVNDMHGHGIGDEVLVLLSQHIKEALREGDTLARIGGDEFVVVLVDLEDQADCKPVLARLLRAASQPVSVGDVVLNVSASIGVTLYPQDGTDADLLLRYADQAMYIAKDSGKNRCHFFDAASASAVQTRRENLQNIVHAMEQHEFVLYYQPKVNMKTGAVVGAEALIRWQHPVRGLLAPAAFLPIIEDHPLSVELGEWVIATAIAQMSAWLGENMDLSVSVNIAARQLQQTDFAARLGEMLAAHPDVKPHCLQLEVLETSALEDVGRVGAVMQACKAIGVDFALDDFGTGYSSLTYLKRLPAETLKIDQSFLRDMLTDPDDLAIVQGIISLASVFRRSVIAEGVETRAHGALLLELGCELAQGYGIARPMPAADMPGWVKNWRTKPVWTA